MSLFINEQVGRGVIYKKERNRLWVALDASCETSKECGVGCCSCANVSDTRKAILTTASEDDALSVGQFVNFKHFIPNAALVAFIIFGIPILCAAMALVIWNYVAPGTVDSPFATATSIASFFAGFSLVWAVDMLYRKKYPATVTPLKDTPQRSEAHG